MPVGGSDQLVRQADGVHLNQTGSRVAADAVIAALRGDFTGF
jgi:lysophospholipase L1-like esterase